MISNRPPNRVETYQYQTSGFEKKGHRERKTKTNVFNSATVPFCHRVEQLCEHFQGYILIDDRHFIHLRHLSYLISSGQFLTGAKGFHLSL